MAQDNNTPDNTIYIAILAPFDRQSLGYAGSLVNSARELGNSLIIDDRVVETPSDIRYSVILRINPDEAPADLFQLLIERLQGLSLEKHKKNRTQNLEAIAIAGLTEKEKWLQALFNINGSEARISELPTAELPKFETLKTPLEIYVRNHLDQQKALQIQRDAKRYFDYFEKELSISYSGILMHKTEHDEIPTKYAVTAISCMLRRKYKLIQREIGEILNRGDSTICTILKKTERLRLKERELNNPGEVYERVVDTYKRAEARTRTAKSTKKNK